jgi:hypothetical protein
VDATIVQPIEAQVVGVDLQGVTVKAKSTALLGVVAV